MINVRTGKDIKDIPVLNENQTYIYVMRNDAGKVKIGRTINIQQRYQSLCGSNGQGNQILDLCCSPATFLFSIEKIMHNKFDKYRIPNTEWFYDKDDIVGELLFNNAVNELRLLFSSASYKKCNALRKNIYEEKKGDANCDN